MTFRKKSPRRTQNVVRRRFHANVVREDFPSTDEIVQILTERIEQEQQYLAHPSAFWLRPDGDVLSDDPYEPQVWTYVDYIYDPRMRGVWEEHTEIVFE